MRTNFLLLILFLAPFLLHGQDLHVYYDVATDSIAYKLNGKYVKQPIVKKGKQVILHVTNFNDYLYNLEIETDEKDYSIPSEGGAGGFGLGQGLGALTELQDIFGSFGLPGFGGGGDDSGFGFAGSEEKTALFSETTYSQKVVDLAAQYQATLREMQIIEDGIQELSEDIEKDIEGQVLNTIMRQELRGLKYNPSLPPKKIKDLSMEYLERILDVKDSDNYDLDDMLKRAKVQKYITEDIKTYEEDVTTLGDKMAELDMVRSQLTALNELYEGDMKNMDRTYTTAKSRVGTYQKRVGDMQKQVPNLKDWDVKELASIRYFYEEMKSHSFEKQFVFMPESDLTTFAISLVPTDSAASNGAQTKSLSPVSVPSFGGLKVNASVGISFAGFRNAPQDYYVRNNVILADDKASFSPVITSFFLFYPQSKGQISLGGTFGLGISVGESAGLQTFLGPSLIMGKGQRIVLSGGLMSGSVDRLSQGLKVGDTYEEFVVPTKSVYEIGYFVGVSFNVLGN